MFFLKIPTRWLFGERLVFLDGFQSPSRPQYYQHINIVPIIDEKVKKKIRLIKRNRPANSEILLLMTTDEDYHFLFNWTLTELSMFELAPEIRSIDIPGNPPNNRFPKYHPFMYLSNL